MTITYTMLVADKDTAGSIKQWMSNTLIPSTLILLQAEQYIFSKLRVRDMLTLATGTIAEGDDTIALPTRYRAPRSFWISGVNKREIAHRTLEDIEGDRQYDSAGDLVPSIPASYFADKDNLNFPSKADQAYPYRFWHYAALEPLSVTNTTNFLTESYPDLLYAACLFRGNLWDDNEEGLVRYQQMTDALVHMANRESDEEAGRGLIADIVVA